MIKCPHDWQRRRDGRWCCLCRVIEYGVTVEQPELPTSSEMLQTLSRELGGHLPARQAVDAFRAANGWRPTFMQAVAATYWHIVEASSSKPTTKEK